MKKLTVKNIVVEQPLSLKMADQLLELQTAMNSIDIINWKEFPYRPDIKFRIAHVNNEIWLKFYVNEKNILAQETRINGDVYKDSTVEFFISADKKNYYNFEISCIGTIHLGHGEGRHNRKMIDPEIVEKIEVQSTLGDQPFAEKSGNFDWEMMIRIPVECFAFDKIESLKGMHATGNFYKCGDETSEPHFVTWNAIGTENPDYHCPEYFGTIEFE